MFWAEICAAQALRRLVADIGPDHLDVLMLREGACPAADSQDRLRKVRTQHTALYLGADGGKALWMERLHPLNCSVAYNVIYG